MAGCVPGSTTSSAPPRLELIYNYGVARVLGIRYGFRGLNPQEGDPPVDLTPEYVERIHYLGGTVLGSSRGPQPPEVMVDFLEREKIDILLCVGGDGTQRGSQAIQQEIQRRGLSKTVVGIPKTIDNDIAYVTSTFGYATALSKAEEVLRAAHTEARNAVNGIGLVRLMGRDAGFIAAGAALISQEANFVLVPEVPFPLDGEQGFLAALERRILQRNHALVVVAEGAGQHLFRNAPQRTDASGNPIHEDIGVFLRERIQEYFAGRKIPISLKYLDPSYLIRSIPATAWDMYLSDQMARHAVHAAMAGKTDVLIGSWYSSLRSRADPHGGRPAQDAGSRRHVVDRGAGRHRPTAVVTESDVRRPSATVWADVSPRWQASRHLPRNSRVLSAQLGSAKSSGSVARRGTCP